MSEHSLTTGVRCVAAAERGATRGLTTSEEENAGNRHVNRKLGYRIVGGQYRLRRPR